MYFTRNLGNYFRVRVKCYPKGIAQGVVVSSDEALLAAQSPATGQYVHAVASLGLWDGTQDDYHIQLESREETPELHLWNVWEGDTGSVDAWTGPTAMKVVEHDDGRLTLFCSNGEVNVNFEDLIVEIFPENREDD